MKKGKIGNVYIIYIYVFVTFAPNVDTRQNGPTSPAYNTLSKASQR